MLLSVLTHRQCRMTPPSWSFDQSTSCRRQSRPEQPASKEPLVPRPVPVEVVVRMECKWHRLQRPRQRRMKRGIAASIAASGVAHHPQREGSAQAPGSNALPWPRHGQPPARYTKAECLEAFERSDWFARLDSRSHLIARTVLQRDNGIEARRLALDSLDEVFAIDPDTLDRRFLAHAPTLAAEAGARALAAAGARRERRSTPSSSAPAPATSARAFGLRRRAARPARRRAGVRPGRPGLRRGAAQPAARPLADRLRARRRTCSRSASR